MSLGRTVPVTRFEVRTDCDACGPLRLNARRERRRSYSVLPDERAARHRRCSPRPAECWLSWAWAFPGGSRAGWRAARFVQPGLDRTGWYAEVCGGLGLGEAGQVVRPGCLPLASEKSADRVVDPACYRGGFRGLGGVVAGVGRAHRSLLPPDPPSGGQATTIRIPHTFAVAPPVSLVTTTRQATPSSSNPDNSIPVTVPGRWPGRIPSRHRRVTQSTRARPRASRHGSADGSLTPMVR